MLNFFSFKIMKISVIGAIILFLYGCIGTFVAPYDENLFKDTEAFYKKAAMIIEDGRLASPRTDAGRQSITDIKNHEGHYSKFEAKYNQLIIDSEALILRALSNSDEIDIAGQEIQAKLNEVIETNNPSECESIKTEFGQVSLTASNYIDLKCIVTGWKARHSDQELTKGKAILKKANWEGRKLIIFNAILAIQKAEAFKKTNDSN